MCGIYLTNLPLKEEELKLKVKRISHQGPDFKDSSTRWFIIWTYPFINS